MNPGTTFQFTNHPCQVDQEGVASKESLRKGRRVDEEGGGTVRDFTHYEIATIDP